MYESRLLDLQHVDDRYLFRFGHGEDLPAKVAAVKRAFAPAERTYDPDKNHLWSVPATPDSERKLAAIFPNAARAFEILHSQMKLPGM